MTVLIDVINQQINESIYKNSSSNAKYRLASKCDAIKKVSIVVAIAVPIFAFFLPYIFGLVSSVACGLIGYDLFNMANNLAHAARSSAEGGNPSSKRTNLDMLLDSTILTIGLFRWFMNDKEPASRDLFSSNAPVFRTRAANANAMKTWRAENIEPNEIEYAMHGMREPENESDFSDEDLIAMYDSLNDAEMV